MQEQGWPPRQAWSACSPTASVKNGSDGLTAKHQEVQPLCVVSIGGSPFHNLLVVVLSFLVFKGSLCSCFILEKSSVLQLGHVAAMTR